jgi:DNA repair exonuclease SbcCD ATPase subunit
MQGIDFSNQLLIKRTANIRVIVTPRWKEEMQQQLQAQVSQIDGQIQQLEAQGQRMIAEIERQSLKPLPAEVAREIENIRLEVNRRKSELLEQKNQLLQQLNQVQVLELEQEVVQGQLDTFCPVGKGDNLIATMIVDIVLRDGVIEDIKTGFPPIVQVQ